MLSALLILCKGNSLVTGSLLRFVLIMIMIKIMIIMIMIIIMITITMIIMIQTKNLKAYIVIFICALVPQVAMLDTTKVQCELFKFRAILAKKSFVPPRDSCLPRADFVAISHMVGHPCHNYGLITRFEVCNALRMWGFALCNSRNA